MYQIAMSVVHEDPDDEKYDSDSCVVGITDLGVGLRSVVLYTREVSAALGVEFTTSTSTDWIMDENSPIYYKAEAPLQSPGRGPATICVELQVTPKRDDTLDIVNMLKVMARFTHPDQYYTN